LHLKYAFRSLLKNPAFSLLAVLVMALGIGANTAVFSVVNAVLLKPLAYRDAERIVTLSSLWKKNGGHGQVSAPDFHDWHDQTTAFDAMAYYDSDETAISTGGAAEYAKVAAGSPEFFRVFGVEPVVGRWFSAEEEKTGSAGAVVISYPYWQSHFGGVPTALGQTVRFGGKALPVVGVAPPGFHFPDQTDVWLPAGMFPETTSRSAHNYLVVGKLKSDVTLGQAQAQMTAIGTRLEQQFPRSNTGKNVAVTPMRDEMVSNVRLTLYLLLGAVGLVLLIACANMANLLLVKATARTREIAIRAAVGASRASIIRQLITESILLSLAAGGAGLAIAYFGSKALVAMAPGNIPRLTEAGVDGSVLVFTLGISVAASLLFGLVPAIHASRVDLNNALKQGAARATGGQGSGRMRSALVVAEIALSVVLLTGASLLIRSFVALHNVALGFRPENVLVMSTDVPSSDGERSSRSFQFYSGLLPDIAAAPGVSAVGATRVAPGQVSSWGGYWVDHLPSGEPGIGAPQAVFSVVAPGTFSTLRIPLRRGRDFDASDSPDAPFTAVINESLAKQSFAGQDPIGRTIYCGFDSVKGMRIVGIVSDIHQYGPARPAQPEMYMPYPQHPRTSSALNVLVRTAADPAALSETLRRMVRQRAPDVPVKFTTLEAKLSENVAAPRFRTLLLGVFAALAVLLSMAGVYGVMAYVVSQRSGELGLRMALGASPTNVQWLVLRQALALTGAGLVVGLAGAVLATRLLTSVLFEVKATDPATYLAVAGLLAVVALAAGYIPALRAARVDPLAALRQD
jgi:putative ABC transport system permease protein